MRLEELGQLKNPVTSGIEPATLGLLEYISQKAYRGWTK
jgi:hypothetical protein